MKTVISLDPGPKPFANLLEQRHLHPLNELLAAQLQSTAHFSEQNSAASSMSCVGLRLFSPSNKLTNTAIILCGEKNKMPLKKIGARSSVVPSFLSREVEVLRTTGSGNKNKLFCSFHQHERIFLAQNWKTTGVRSALSQPQSKHIHSSVRMF